ncbi:MAG: o-succinylbenzoate synthase [Bacteroidetes bacterium QS_1_63_11]|nr:MAG: o-succinylbenzoate synthase [Bacteroidetes bacterium QS_1_63_11]
MVVSTISLYRYTLPLTPPLSLGGETHSRRRGLLVRLGTRQGAAGWGDAAPLPGFSVETLDDVVEHARVVAPEWTGRHVPGPEDDLSGLLGALSMGANCPASLRFAAESALVELLAAARTTSPAAVLGTENEGLAQAARLREHGYPAVKVKVGRESVEEDVRGLRAIRKALGDDTALRADANRAWSMEQAVAFAEATQDLGMAYVEEPLTNPVCLPELAARTDVPIALDETTRENEASVLRDDAPVAAVVLKPTLLGGLRATLRWRHAAQANSVTPVISAAYESGIGLRTLVALAAAGPDAPAGLSTYDRLSADVITPRLSLDDSSVDVSSVTDSPVAVDGDRITLVDSFSA